MRAFVVIGLFALVGCDQAFRLGRAEVDASGYACWNELLVGDEDGDTLPDGCDPCPVDPDAAIVNGDGDGLGDACDPRSAEDAQSIVAFDGFEQPGSWQVDAGGWQFSGGDLSIAGAAFDARSELQIPATRHPGADVLFDTTSGGGTRGVYFGFGPGIEAGCLHELRNAPNPDRLVLRVNSTTVAETPLDVGGSIRITMFQDADGILRCRGSGGLVESGEIAFTGLTMDTSARMALVVHGDTAFHAVTIFATR